MPVPSSRVLKRKEYPPVVQIPDRIGIRSLRQQVKTPPARVTTLMFAGSPKIQEGKGHDPCDHYKRYNSCYQDQARIDRIDKMRLRNYPWDEQCPSNRRNLPGLRDARGANRYGYVLPVLPIWRVNRQGHLSDENPP